MPDITLLCALVLKPTLDALAPACPHATGYELASREAACVIEAKGMAPLCTA